MYVYKICELGMYTLFCQWHLAEKNRTKWRIGWEELAPVSITWSCVLLDHSL
jgi:hypothetical protein